MRVTGPVDSLTRATLKIIASANGCTDTPRPPIRFVGADRAHPHVARPGLSLVTVSGRFWSIYLACSGRSIWPFAVCGANIS